MTLGNLYAYDRACLLFLDPSSGLMLQLSGSATVEFPEKAEEQLDKGDCLVRVKIEQVCRIEDGAVVRTEPIRCVCNGLNSSLSMYLSYWPHPTHPTASDRYIVRTDSTSAGESPYNPPLSGPGAPKTSGGLANTCPCWASNS